MQIMIALKKFIFVLTGEKLLSKYGVKNLVQ